LLENLPELDGRAPRSNSSKTANRLFQRPDDAIHRGYDKQTEADFSRPDNFFSNYEPLTRQRRARPGRGRHRFLSIHRADAELIKAVAAPAPDYFVCSAHPRLVDGKPTKNPRYLQSGPT
jgi:phosphoenolpyruvate carboxykinase (diphosphate)